ncbi:hypothetical protein AVEN_104497-1 [Araneus ventricosus]|uniref:Uncharacterized protein n=1 Tax=Araneus ventricosus TaxID=182803 RepID=A0A4Y2IMM1_ARAVE|nr:hypothetical protein AVEN_104497-1 [Araneus ventricosus]
MLNQVTRGGQTNKARPSPHIAILDCDKFAEILLCKLAISLTRQDRKFTTRLQQVNANELVTTRQTHCKLEQKQNTTDKPRIRTPDNPLHSQSS